MKKLNYTALNKFIVTDIIRPFYEKRVSGLNKMDLKDIIKRKNPYLFNAKNIQTAGNLAKYILDAFLSSQEETIFGDLLENLAIRISKEVFGGYKAEKGKFPSVDLIFERNKKLYIVGVKSGPNWGNSDQVNIMRRNLEKAKRQFKNKVNNKEIFKVNGCMYGKDDQPYKKDKKNPGLSYYKICGQKFWELISGDDQLYKRIVQPLDKEAKKRDETFKTLYNKKMNELTKDLINSFCRNNLIDWNRIIDYVSKASGKKMKIF